MTWYEVYVKRTAPEVSIMRLLETQNEREANVFASGYNTCAEGFMANFAYVCEVRKVK